LFTININEEEEIADKMELSVPKLMILGILFTSSNAQQRAERFYDLIQMDLEPQISKEDKEFQEFFPLICIIGHCLMIRHFN